MSIRSITALAIPVLLLACGGAESPTSVEPPVSAGVRAPLDTPSRSNDPSSPRVDPSSSQAPSTSSVPADTQQLLQAQLANASVSLDQATDAALAANPGSQLREADLDGNGADVRYEIELRLADGSVVEVHVDATTGDIIATFPEDDDNDSDGDDDAAIDCTGAISALEAQEIAEVKAAGTAVEVEIDDGCQFEVTVETATGFVEVDVAPDGTVSQVENDDGPDDADDDDSDGDDDDDSDDVDSDGDD